MTPAELRRLENILTSTVKAAGDGRIRSAWALLQLAQDMVKTALPAGQEKRK